MDNIDHHFLASNARHRRPDNHFSYPVTKPVGGIIDKSQLALEHRQSTQVTQSGADHGLHHSLFHHPYPATKDNGGDDFMVVDENFQDNGYSHEASYAQLDHRALQEVPAHQLSDMQNRFHGHHQNPFLAEKRQPTHHQGKLSGSRGRLAPNDDRNHPHYDTEKASLYQRGRTNYYPGQTQQDLSLFKNKSTGHQAE